MRKKRLSIAHIEVLSPVRVHFFGFSQIAAVLGLHLQSRTLAVTNVTRGGRMREAEASRNLNVLDCAD